MRILIVDDNADFRLLMSKMLAQRGHEVRSCETPFGVSAVVMSEQPDLVVLDIEMPGLDGVTLAKLLLKLNMLKAPAIVLCSNSDGEKLRAAGVEAGVPAVQKCAPSQLIPQLERLSKRTE